MTAEEKAIEMGAKIQVSFGWTWAVKFSSYQTALAFVEWLTVNGYECHGTFFGTNDVKFRKIGESNDNARFQF